MCIRFPLFFLQIYHKIVSELFKLFTISILGKIFNLVFEGYYMTLQREGGAAAGSGTADITGLSDVSAEMKASSFGTHSRDLSQLMAAGPFDTSSFCDLIKENYQFRCCKFSGKFLYYLYYNIHWTTMDLCMSTCLNLKLAT